MIYYNLNTMIKVCGGAGAVSSLAEVLASGNVTGLNNILVSNGQVIKAENGASLIDLRNGSDGQVRIEGTSDYLTFGNGSFSAFGGSFLTDIAFGSFNLSPIGSSLSLFKSDFSKSGEITIYENSLGNLTGGTLPNYPTVISSQNNTVNQNVINSTILGGINVVAKTNNSTYCNQIAYNNGTDGELIVKHTPSATDFVQTFQAKTGTIANLDDLLQKRIIVNQSNVSAILGGVIDGSKEYFIDGVVDMSGVTVNVPIGGLNIKGYNFETSKLICSDNNYTMFLSASSGNVLFIDFAIEVTGANSKVFDLTSNTGNEAFEQININYNNCTNRGELTEFRQGREVGCGYFGGSPTLTLSGTMLGGYVFRDSIVRGLDNTFMGALFQQGTSLLINSRFLSDANIDLGTNCSFIDFQPSNFSNSSSVQLKSMVITRNGVSNPNDTNITPNLMPSDLACIWRLNQGLLNTYVGGSQAITSTSTTIISSDGTFYTLAGTWGTSDLQHFDNPSNGQLRNLGESPNEFKIITYVILDGGSNDLITIRIRKFDDSTSTFSTIASQDANINNFQGGNDRCTFSILGKAVLNMNDYVFLEVANNTDRTNVTALSGSFLTIEER